MKSILVCAVALVLVGCNPFVADDSPSSTPRSPGIPSDDALVGAYIDCVNGYVVLRASYDVTAYELADAAIGACSSELNDVRARSAQRTTPGGGERIAAKLREDARAGALTIAVEIRNTQKPSRTPAAISGT